MARPVETESDAFKRGTAAAAATTTAVAGAEPAKSGEKWWPTPDPAVLVHLTPQPPDKRRDTVDGHG